MNNTPPTTAELALLGCWAVALALRTLLAHGLALALLLAGWRPARPAVTITPAPAPAPAPAPEPAPAPKRSPRARKRTTTKPARVLEAIA
jgi:hypothetical protein